MALVFPTLILFGSTLAHLYLAPKLLNGYPAGGIVGTHIAEILQAFLGFWGSLILLYALLVTTFVVTTKLSIRGLASEYVVPLLQRVGELLMKRMREFREKVPLLRASFAAMISSRSPAFATGTTEILQASEDIAVGDTSARRLDPDPPVPVIRNSGRHAPASTIDMDQSSSPNQVDERVMLTTSKNELIEDVTEVKTDDGVFAPEVVDQPAEKPIVNRRKAQAQPQRADRDSAPRCWRL